MTIDLTAELIATGTELLLGQTVNSNAQYISQRLADLGINVYFHTTVGDNKERLRKVINQALERADIVITTGGLGPTKDDLTKEIVAEIFNLPLNLNEDELAKIKLFFQRRQREMPENNIKQAMIPEGGIVMPNPIGTAPGVILEKHNKIVVMLPGPPVEMKRMFDEYAAPFLMGKTRHANKVILSKVLKVMGPGESSLDNILDDLLSGMTNPTVALLAKTGEVHVRITAKSSDYQTASDEIAKLEKQIRKRIGEYIYGTDDQELAEVVGELLAKHKLTLAVAESCTGGLLGSKITDIPGSSLYFDSSLVCYSNKAKIRLLGVNQDTIIKYGAVSHETAQEMALGLLKDNVDLGLAITGIAGPTGETPDKPVGLVYIARAYQGRAESQKFYFPGNRVTIKTLAAKNALNYLRQLLIDL